jgi:predicted enzyme related to lactoylglutathione lyase
MRMAHAEAHRMSARVSVASEARRRARPRRGTLECSLATTGEGPGINGAIVPRRGPRPAVGQPVNAYSCTIEVSDLEATTAQILARGGALAMARMPIPGVGWRACFHDSEGTSSA